MPKAFCSDHVRVVHKPRLLSDNGSSYVSGDLAEWLQDKGMTHSRGAPYHPQTWTYRVFVPTHVLVKATFLSKATGLFQPSAECWRRGL